MKRNLLWVVCVVCVLSGPVWSQGYGSLGNEQAELDRQANELSREIFAARLAGDNQKVQELSKKLEPIQKRRVEVLQALGELPRNSAR